MGETNDSTQLRTPLSLSRNQLAALPQIGSRRLVTPRKLRGALAVSCLGRKSILTVFLRMHNPRLAVVVGYFEFVGFDALIPETRSQNTKAHQITNTRSRMMAPSVAGFTNKSTGVKISNSVPRTSFQLNLCEFTLPIFPPSAARKACQRATKSSTLAVTVFRPHHRRPMITRVTPMQTRSTPAHLLGVTCSPRKNFPPNAPAP